MRRRSGESKSLAARFFENEQRVRVLACVAAAACNGNVITAALALVTCPIGYPPSCWMIKEKGLENRLKKIDQVVVTLDVRELVREQHVQLKRSEPGDQACGNYDDWTYRTNHEWNIHSRRLEQPNGASDSKPVAKFLYAQH